MYQKLVQEQPVTCAITGTEYDALPHPNYAIIDVGVWGPCIFHGLKRLISVVLRLRPINQYQEV